MDEVPYNCAECDYRVESRGYIENYQHCGITKKELDYETYDYKRDENCPIKKPEPYKEPEVFKLKVPRFFEIKDGAVKEVNKRG